MINLTLDTDFCVSLISQKLTDESFLLDELYFWVERRLITLILPTNILDEWQRNKEKRIEDIRKQVRSITKLNEQIFPDSKVAKKILNADTFEALVRVRVNKLENMFRDFAKIAPLNEEILLEAGKRNLATLAPNHIKDSYRDTVNVLSLAEFCKSNGLSSIIFATKNTSDYSDIKDVLS